MIVVDADIVAFRAAFSAEDEPEAWVACSRAENMLNDMSYMLGEQPMELWLSGKNNFRYNVFPEYKANRLEAKRPKWEHEVKDYLVKEWNANWSEGCEADDMIGVRALETDGFVASIDKDLDQIPGWHYNFVKKERYFVTSEEATRHFYYQLLVGDTADGVKGVYGVGPKKAKKLLDSCDSEEGMYWAVRDLYGSYEAFEMTAKVLWIWKKRNDIWTDTFDKETMDPST